MKTSFETGGHEIRSEILPRGFPNDSADPEVVLPGADIGEPLECSVHRYCCRG